MPRRTYELELVEELHAKREPGFLYFLRGSDIWRTPMAPAKGKAEQVAAGSFQREPGYEYYVSPEGNVTRLRRRLADAIAEGWPDRGEFHALAEGRTVELRFGAMARLSVQRLGSVSIRSGTMTIADPLVGFHQPFSARVEVPNGDHPVTVTWADFVESDGEMTRGAAYATVALSDAPETRRALYRHPSANDDPFHHHAVGVDSGVIMFIDSEATPGRLRRLRWMEKIDRERGCSLGWFTRSVGCSTAGLDRFYPVVLGYDRDRLVRVHVDFMIAPPASAFAGRPGM